MTGLKKSRDNEPFTIGGCAVRDRIESILAAENEVILEITEQLNLMKRTMSLSVKDLVDAISKNYGIEMSIDEFIEMGSLDRVVVLIYQKIYERLKLAALQKNS